MNAIPLSEFDVNYTIEYDVNQNTSNATHKKRLFFIILALIIVIVVIIIIKLL